MRLRALGLLALSLAVVAGAGRAAERALQDRFDHWEHRALFPSCLGCHAGAEDSSRSLWPRPSDCAVCHDGTIEKTVEWSPPGGPRASNLRFTHLSHTREVTQAGGVDSTLRAAADRAELP